MFVYGAYNNSFKCHTRLHKGCNSEFTPDSRGIRVVFPFGSYWLAAKNVGKVYGLGLRRSRQSDISSMVTTSMSGVVIYRSSIRFGEHTSMVDLLDLCNLITRLMSTVATSGSLNHGSNTLQSDDSDPQ